MIIETDSNPIFVSNNLVTIITISVKPRLFNVCQGSITCRPKSGGPYISKTTTFGGLEESERALNSAEKAIEENPNDAHAWYQNGAALNNLNRYQESVRSFNRALKFNLVLQ